MTQFSDRAVWLSSTASTVAALQLAYYFRTKFVVRAKVTSAVLRFSGLGVVEPWMNGERVADDFFTPGWSDYRKRAYVCSYDVSKQLQAGDNCLGVVLADGWAGPPFGPKGHAVTFAPQTKFIAELVITYQNASVQKITSNADWVCRKSPVLKQSIYNGETFDARKELKGWSHVDAPARGWKPVLCVETPVIELNEKKCPPVRITEARRPIDLQKVKSKWIVDFGQNLVGTLRIHLRNTKPGQRVVLKYAETLQTADALYFANLRDAAATDVYICKGAVEEVYMPRFTFHGFRYAQVEGLSGSLHAEDLVACVLHNDLKKTGKFTCSDPLINQLQSNIVWGQRGNFLEAPTDCPQRDERLGWSGDAQVFVDTACFNYDCEGFYRQWMDSMRDGQRSDGAFPDTAPDILNWHGNAGWGDAGVIVPHAVWQHYGSLEIVRENWDAMVEYMDFLQRQAMGYIQPDTRYGDWLAVDAARPEWSPTPKDLIGTAYFARDAQMMARMATALGKRKVSKSYAKLASVIKKAFQERFITKTGHVLGDTQTSYLLALGFDLVPEDRFEAASEHLVVCIKSRDWHLSTGFLGTPLLNPVLTKVGRCDVAYILLKQETYPSWLYPLKNGATTMWERWNSWTKEAGFGPVEMNSFNHYAYGAIGEWLYQRDGGIAPHPDFPGYQRAIFAPLPGGGLKRGEATMKTRAGQFVSKWHVKSSGVHVTFTIPKGADAVVRLPILKWSYVRMDGAAVPKSYKQKCTSRFGKCEMLLPAGTYKFVIKETNTRDR
ncbi:MAG: family 78 glycoside hydrolase catalytic domain [Lentimonas sp.]